MNDVSDVTVLKALTIIFTAFRFSIIVTAERFIRRWSPYLSVHTHGLQLVGFFS